MFSEPAAGTRERGPATDAREQGQKSKLFNWLKQRCERKEMIKLIKAKDKELFLLMQEEAGMQERKKGS